MLPSAGPTAGKINSQSGASITDAPLTIIDVNDSVARNVLAGEKKALFADALGDGYRVGSIIGRGDALDINIWEAPPAALFGTSGAETRTSTSQVTARGTSFPEQVVNSDGRISLPFVGSLQAAGRTPQQIERDIVARLTGKAHDPQAIVRVVRNVTSTISVVGDVAANSRVTLTPRGERVLDVIAMVGGVRQPIGKMTIQITRGSQVVSMPMDVLVRDPRQNIRLQPDDVVTALFQPFSFTALGATGRNEELPFEATGITLAQALGRVAGLQDARANVKGAFIFRLEQPDALDPAMRATAKTTPDGRVPVIYRIDLSNPATFFVAQSFPIRNRDVLYVSNAPFADFQKFVAVVSSTVLPVATSIAATR